MLRPFFAIAMLARVGLRNCDRDLRAWYDANPGTRAAA